MKVFNEPELMNIIKERYECDDIYTYCGTTLISVNPYALFEGEYNQEKKDMYTKHLDNPFFMMKSIPPHLYSIAISALHELKYGKEEDIRMNLIIDGEVGSGKTEASIYLLDFVVYCMN
jgi:myosin heavy subunit